MVMGSSTSKLNNLDIPFDSLSILCPSMKLSAEEALPVEAGDGVKDFTEEDSLFVDMSSDEEHEVHMGASSDYFRAPARPNYSTRLQWHSPHQSNKEDEVHSGAFSEASAWQNSALSQLNSANRSDEEDGAYKGAFFHHSRASAELKSGCPQANSARSRSIFAQHRKENAIPCDSNTGHKSVDVHHMRLPASYGKRSLPLDIAPALLNMAVMRRSRRAKKDILSVRKSLLAEAWERKRELLLNEDLPSYKACPNLELLRQSSSDSGKLIADVETPSELRRSCTRSPTDDDFEELRGCIDLGIRFDKSSIRDLCNTLPALKVCCAVAQNFQESPNCMSPYVQLPVHNCLPPSTASS